MCGSDNDTRYIENVTKYLKSRKKEREEVKPIKGNRRESQGLKEKSFKSKT